MPRSRSTFIFYSPRDVPHSSVLQKVLESVRTCRQPLSQNSRMSQAKLLADAALPLRLLLRLGLDDACCECSADASADFMLSCTTLHGIHAHLQKLFPSHHHAACLLGRRLLLRRSTDASARCTQCEVLVSRHCSSLRQPRPHIPQATKCRCSHKNVRVHAYKAQEAPLKAEHTADDVHSNLQFCRNTACGAWHGASANGAAKMDAQHER